VAAGIPRRAGGRLLLFLGRRFAGLPGITQKITAAHMTATSEELAFTPVHQLAADIAGGALTSAKLTGVFLSRIASHGEKLHAFVTVYADEAMRAAQAADQA